MKRISTLILGLFTLTLIFACGGEEKKETDEKKKVKIEEKKVERKEDSNTANIVITGDDLMKFNTSEIRVKAGQKVRLTLRHIGKMDVKIMGHNVVILKQGVNMIEFAAVAAAASDNQYIPKDTQDVLAHTDLIGGGQTTTIEFDAPEVGSYDFICSFPAHYAMMKGKFIVE